MADELEEAKNDEIETQEIEGLDPKKVDTETTVEEKSNNENSDNEASKTDDEAKPGDNDSEEDKPLSLSLSDDDDEEEGKPSEDNSNFRQLRKRHREEQKARKKAERELEAIKAAGAEKAQVTELRKEPSLDDHDYDEDAYKKDVKSWLKEKREIDAAQAEIEEQHKAEQQSWNDSLNSHNEKRAELEAHPDYEEAETLAIDALSPAQQAIIVRGSKNSPLILMALGKNPKRLAKLAAITDPIEFAFAISREETNMKVTGQSKSKPTPENRLKGAGGSVSSFEKQIKAARAKGDIKEVQRLKRAQKQKE